MPMSTEASTAKARASAARWLAKNPMRLGAVAGRKALALVPPKRERVPREPKKPQQARTTLTEWLQSPCDDGPVQLPYPLDREVWRKIPGWDGYEASCYGRIRSWRCPNGSPYVRNEPHRMVPSDGHGYLKVRLQSGIRSKRCYVHRLVLLAFAGHAPEGMDHTRHLDGTRRNNNVNNLCWGTAKQNGEDRTRLSRWAREAAQASVF